jgi:hypothetical protein
LVLIARSVDNMSMTLLLILISLAAIVGFGVLAVAYGADSRITDTRDTRPSWF